MGDIMKNNNKVNKSNSKNLSTDSATGELKKISIILVSIIGIVCVFYIITVVVTKGNQTLLYSKEDSISQISYTEILASDILNKDGTYYVLVEDSEDAYLDLFRDYMNAYIALDEHFSVYYVDLNDAFNQNYKGDENNFENDKLVFKGTTLLKVSNNNIESVYENNESISNHLKDLIG